MNKNFILTAAHCIISRPISSIKIVFGTNDLNFIDQHRKEGFVAEKIIHPLYDTSEFYYDIGVLKLTEELVFDQRVAAVCLPDSPSNNYDNRKGIVGQTI